MKIFLVGGAVRDALLNVPHQEKDWVVTESTPEEMLAQGFRPVGKDFPVFLHPDTQEEYALARTERKTGKGYTQFVFHTSKDVTLEEDLRRRDLTINAMAMTDAGEIIDPWGGQQDLKSRLLRHVSEAFVEDPVRILRIARLLARFAPMGFKIAPETYQLMQKMVDNGEVDALVPDRVWAEWNRALGEREPWRFLEALNHCGALQKLFPELAPCFSYHYSYYQDMDARILCFAKYLSKLDVRDIQHLCRHYPVPSNYRETALVAHQLQIYFQQKKLSPENILEILEKSDAYRRASRFYLILKIFKDSSFITELQKAFEATQNISVEDFIQQGHQGQMLGKLLRDKRLEIIKRL